MVMFVKKHVIVYSSECWETAPSFVVMFSKNMKHGECPSISLSMMSVIGQFSKRKRFTLH
jgi:hypothetical protein